MTNVQQFRVNELARHIGSLSLTFGDGPWLHAAMGRLMAAAGHERPDRPWWANTTDWTDTMVGWERENARIHRTTWGGFLNRSQRKHLHPRYQRVSS